MSLRQQVPFLFFSLCALVSVAVPGCGGCRRQPPAETEKKGTQAKPEEKPKEDFEMATPVTVPGEPKLAFPFVKPGHWVTVRHEILANHFDLQGELWTSAGKLADEPIEVENTPFALRAIRPAPLPKGQRKLFDTSYFIPRAAADRSAGIWLHRELREQRGGRLVKEDPAKVAVMPPFQYFLLVLSSQPDRYGYLKQLTAISAPTSDDPETDSWLYYRVLLPPVTRSVPLPAQSLTWSSTAYIIWDDVDPAILTPDQQQALLDWLHWGGQIIISGPNTLEKMRGRFLEAYLPAEFERTVETSTAELGQLNAHWSLASAKQHPPAPLTVPPGGAVTKVQMRKHPAADYLPGTGELVAERRVGAGRIVVTSFSLTDRSVVNWGSFDSFFNACLLRRPRRQFESKAALANAKWADYHPALANDSRLSTTLRYFSRDIGHFVSEPQGLRPVAEPETIPIAEALRAGTTVRQPRTAQPEPVAIADRNPQDDGPHFGGYPYLPLGVAAWNDRSGAADAARQALKDAAGISVPNSRFVIRVLLAYLVCLVPLNWGFFRLLGRVEWAWFAAPCIAVATTILVVRFAQLNIGFARSVTEIAVAETQADYPRAHLTRYIALYTSLSTSYNITFDRADALAQPFGSVIDYVRGPNDSIKTVTLRRDQELRLQGFQVPSNSTAIVHCEQMCDLGGSFSLAGNADSGWRLQNTTNLQLHDAGVLLRQNDGSLRTAWIGEIASGSAKPLILQPALQDRPHCRQWNESPAMLSYETQVEATLARFDRNNDQRLSLRETLGELGSDFARWDQNGDQSWSRNELTLWCRRSRAGDVSLGQLVELASQGLHLARGEARLIGWTDTPLPGMEVRPESAQRAARTLVLVHLRRGSWPLPRPDVNRLTDVMESVTPTAENPPAVPAVEGT
jgi:hypothetical protein